MDRYSFSIKDGRLVLGDLFAVGNVSGHRCQRDDLEYPWSIPGHALWTAIEAWLYPDRPEPGDGDS